MNKTCLQ